MENKVVAKDCEHLKSLIEDAIEKNGPNCDLNFIDVSNITDMSGLFEDSRFDGDISKWDVSNVRDMRSIFDGSAFDGDISAWDLAKIEKGKGPNDLPPGGN